MIKNRIRCILTEEIRKNLIFSFNHAVALRASVTFFQTVNNTLVTEIKKIPNNISVSNISQEDGNMIIFGHLLMKIQDNTNKSLKNVKPLKTCISLKWLRA